MKEKKSIIRNSDKPIQKIRFAVQLLFALMCIWIGIEFHHFIAAVETGVPANVASRPPGVEGFLPISAMMSVYYFLISGDISMVHPAGFFIFVGIVAVSFTFGKSFCSWMCPVGFISELIGDFGDKVSKKLFGRKIKMPKLIDVPLRGLKYLLLGFFVYMIFFAMTAQSLKFFLDSPYNKIADVKMYYFFANVSQFSLIVIGTLFLLSIFFRNFWCRYLCPYGALLGIISFFSPAKIKRNTTSCIDCNLCAKACPSFIKVDKVKTVMSDECSMCLSCVDACPVRDTLEVRTVPFNKRISKKAVAIGVVAIYFIVIGYAMISGYWQNNISPAEYIQIHGQMNSIGHPTNSAAIEELNKESRQAPSR